MICWLVFWPTFFDLALNECCAYCRLEIYVHHGLKSTLTKLTLHFLLRSWWIKFSDKANYTRKSVKMQIIKWIKFIYDCKRLKSTIIHFYFHAGRHTHFLFRTERPASTYVDNYQRTHVEICLLDYFSLHQMYKYMNWIWMEYEVDWVPVDDFRLAVLVTVPTILTKYRGSTHLLSVVIHQDGILWCIDQEQVLTSVFFCQGIRVSKEEPKLASIQGPARRNGFGPWNKLQFNV